MTTPDTSTLTAATIVDFLVGILERRGAESYLGEDVTMLEHMLQSAHAAEEAGANDELVVAALLHDIGHYTNEFPEDAHEHEINNYHDTAGAAVLKPYFPDAGYRLRALACRCQALSCARPSFVLRSTFARIGAQLETAGRPDERRRDRRLRT